MNRGGYRAHGLTGSPTYRSWRGSRYRCENPLHPHYSRYGGRGIRVCDRWSNSFEDFLADMGLRPPGTSLDRIDNNGHYEPMNCRWATRQQQSSNRRNTHFVEFDGRRQSIGEWSREVGICVRVLANRLNMYGWSAHQALTTPVGRSR